MSDKTPSTSNKGTLEALKKKKQEGGAKLAPKKQSGPALRPKEDKRLHLHTEEQKRAEIAAGRKKPGRKPVPPEKKRRHPVTIYLDDQEMKRLKDRAEDIFSSPQKYFGMLVRKSGILDEDLD